MKRHLAILAVFLIAATAGIAAADDAAAAKGVVNVNTAKVEQLQLLPRIGPALAQRIIDFREANGPFKSADELVAVKGIGDRSVELLKPHVAVKGETTLDAKVRVPRRAQGSANAESGT